MHFVSGQ